jgi:EF-P beta-lysylation protein EpmB
MTHWKNILRQSFTDISLLCDYLKLSKAQKEHIEFSPSFPFLLPRRLAKKMAKKRCDDPLFLQFVPLKKEKEAAAGFSLDPVGEHGALCEKKLIHRYEGRALLLSTFACAMNCRFCFRRHFPYEKEKKSFEKELSYIRNDPSIHEAILSGGDPLMLDDTVLEGLLRALEKIPHIERLRIHTRLLSAIPARVDAHFLAILKKLKKPLYFVLHINHPNELDDDFWKSTKALQKAGAFLLCQTVLLKGVNDSFDTLYALFSSLVNHGISPYYLHSLDRVQGAHFFEVEKGKGKKIIAELRRKLSGFAIPQYVQEEPLSSYKRPL